MWNGEDDSPNPDPHAKTADKPSTIRRSNPVYVKPPLSTDIEKKVNEKNMRTLRQKMNSSNTRCLFHGQVQLTSSL